MSTELPRATPWYEPAVYVECPWCDFCHLVESDMSASLPTEDETMECERCHKSFVMEGRP